jgi:Kdo2-lipid IVA lauroyltransferase/acyltransferase
VTKARRQRIETQAAAAVSAVIRRLPRRVALALGGALGTVWGRLDRRHVAIAVDNLRHAFPDWDEDRLQATARGVYTHFGRVIVELLWLPGRKGSDLTAFVDVVGAEHVEAARAAGKGHLIVSAHMGNWEIHGLNHSFAFEPIGLVVRALDNPALDERLCAVRRQGGNTIIYKQRALSQILKMLRDNRGIAILIDQNVQAGDGVFVDFFGRQAATTTVAAALAVKTGCALIPSHSAMQPDGRYRAVYGPPVEWTPSGDREADIRVLTQRLTTSIEEWVRGRPEQWLWLHKRWKTRPDA